MNIEERIAVLEAQVSALAQRLDAHESWASKFDASPDTTVIPPETIAKANAPNDMRVVIETKDTPDGFQMNVRTHERGTGYPITESDESKRIAEAVANTPHSC